MIHTAGVIGRGPIREKTVAEARRILRPKIGGARALGAALRESPPEFFILCSSLAARQPVAGQVDYCAANAALDAFARAYARETGVFTVSIGWGFWQELGMIEKAAMPAAEKQRIADEIRARGLSNAGADLFETILLRCSGPEILVSPDGWPDAVAPDTVAADTRVADTPAATRRITTPVSHPLLDSREDTPDAVTYVGHLSAATHWVLDEHRLDGTAVLPGTAYLELVRAAFADATGANRMEIRDASFVQPLLFKGEERREIRVILRPPVAPREFFVVSRVGDDRWRLHARGDVAPLAGSMPAAVDVRAWEAGCDEDFPASSSGACRLRAALDEHAARADWRRWRDRDTRTSGELRRRDRQLRAASRAVRQRDGLSANPPADPRARAVLVSRDQNLGAAARADRQRRRRFR